MSDNVQLPNTENPKMWGHMSRLMANLVLKFSNLIFVTIATRYGLTKIITYIVFGRPYKPQFGASISDSNNAGLLVY